MKTYFQSNKDAVEFVKDLLQHSEADFASITIMPQEKSVDFSVLTATDTSSEDTVTQFFSQTQVNT